MNKDEILDNLMKITHQPFLVFANNVEEKSDSAFETLKLLSDEENVTAGRISEVLDIKPSSVTQIVKKLEEAGTAIREKSEQDSRVTLVKITDKGRESLSAHGAIGSTLKDALFESFTDEELDHLNDYLQRMEDNISSDQFQDRLEEIFNNDQRWERFGKMSPFFNKARNQMLAHNHHHRGFDDHFGGFDGWKRGRR